MKSPGRSFATRLALVAALALASAARAQTSADAGYDGIPSGLHIDEEISLDLEQIYVTVTGRHGRRVLDLGRDDFTVFDEGRAQRIVTFERGDVPFTAVLLLDGSRSMRGRRFETALAGADRFIAGMHELDEARLMVFSEGLLAATPWGHDREALSALLTRLSPHAGSAILDHLYLALMRLDERQGRRVVVLLTDGWDLHSVVTPEQVRHVARRNQALIFWVRLAHSDRGAPWSSGVPIGSWRDLKSAKRIFDELEHLVKESGGRTVEVTLGDLASAFADILAELREQYVLGFYPDSSVPADAYRSIRIELKRRGLDIRACQGYQRR